MHKKFKKAITAIIIAAVITSAGITNISANASEYPTGVGMSAHALNAYVERWDYVWGGTSYGQVDCSGLIATYHGVGGIRTDMLASSPTSGLVSEGIPRIHGLGLYQPGHVGVYIGSNVSIDARSTQQGVCYQNAYTKGWTHWFKIVGVGYPSEGFVRFNDHAFFYENGEYVINCTREINGETYTFDQFGYADHMPPDDVYAMTDYYDQQAFENNRKAKQEQQEREEKQRREQEAERKKQEAEEKAKKQRAEQLRKKAAENTAATKYSLSAGSTGKYVSEIQSLLKKQGYLTDYNDGYYDKNTEDAVKIFQKKNNMKVTGKTSNKTYKLLKSHIIIKKNQDETPLLEIFMKYAVPKNMTEDIAVKINEDAVTTAK